MNDEGVNILTDMLTMRMICEILNEILYKERELKVDEFEIDNVMSEICVDQVFEEVTRRDG